MRSKSRKRNASIYAGSSKLRRKVLWVSGQDFRYQTIFLLKSPQNYFAKVKINLSHCTDTALVAKGLASCCIYTSEMIISKIPGNGFLVSFHAFYSSMGKSWLLMLQLTPKCGKEHGNSFKQKIVYLPNIINSSIETQVNHQNSSLILWVWFSP